MMFDEEIKKCCGTCAYSCYDRMNDYVCEDYEEKQ